MPTRPGTPHTRPTLRSGGSQGSPVVEHDAYLDYLSRPEVAIVTITVTEAAYLRTPDGGLDASRDVVQRDLKALRKDPRAPVDSLPARLVAGLVARRSAGAAALTILSCDNLPENGAVTKTVVRDLAALLDARRRAACRSRRCPGLCQRRLAPG